jgi:hypothetical protein
MIAVDISGVINTLANNLSSLDQAGDLYQKPASQLKKKYENKSNKNT